MKYLGERTTMTLRYPVRYGETLERRAAAQGIGINELICSDVERGNRNFEKQNGGEAVKNGSHKADR
jgi:hypothetical protein